MPIRPGEPIRLILVAQDTCLLWRPGAVPTSPASGFFPITPPMKAIYDGQGGGALSTDLDPGARICLARISNLAVPVAAGDLNRMLGRSDDQAPRITFSDRASVIPAIWMVKEDVYRSVIGIYKERGPLLFRGLVELSLARGRWPVDDDGHPVSPSGMPIVELMKSRSESSGDYVSQISFRYDQACPNFRKGISPLMIWLQGEAMDRGVSLDALEPVAEAMAESLGLYAMLGFLRRGYTPPCVSDRMSLSLSLHANLVGVTMRAIKDLTPNPLKEMIAARRASRS